MPAWPHQSLLALALACTVAGCAASLPSPPPAPAAPAASAPAADPAIMERLQARQDDLSRRLQQFQDQFLLLEARLADQQQAIAEIRRSLAAEKVTPSGQITAPAESPPGAPPPSPTDVYLQAFGDYAAGRYPQAIQGFSLFLKHFPDNDYAGNAVFWLAECFYAQQQYPRAAAAFAQVADHYPNSSKAPDALLRLAETQLRQGDSGQADETLRRLRSRYPDSSAARKSLPAP